MNAFTIGPPEVGPNVRGSARSVAYVNLDAVAHAKTRCGPTARRGIPSTSKPLRERRDEGVDVRRPVAARRGPARVRSPGRRAAVRRPVRGALGLDPAECRRD